MSTCYLFSINAQQLFQKKYLMQDGTVAQNIQKLNLSNDCYSLITNNEYKLTLSRIDDLGNLVWARDIGRDSMRNIPVSLVVLNNDDVVVGMFWDDGAFGSIGQNSILKFDQNGNNIFIKRYTDQIPNGRCLLNQIIKDGSGFTAIVMPSNSSPFNSRIIKMDAGGNRLNSISIGSHYLKIMKSANNYYYL